MSGEPSGDIGHYSIFKLAIELEGKGRDIIHLEVGDPEVDMDRAIIEAMCQKAKEGYIHYGGPYGINELREEVVSYLKDRLGIDTKPNMVLITPGAKTGLYLTLNLLLRRGSRIVVIEPTWSAYKGLADSLGMNYIPIKTSFENSWLPDEGTLDSLRGIDFDALILLNPSNPTGKLIPGDIVEELISIAEKKSAVVISDEIYFETLFRGPKHYPSVLKYGYNNVVGLYSLSKSHAMTGFRLGWLIAREDWIERLASMVQYIYTNVPLFIQYAGIAALKNRKIPDLTREVYKRRIDILASSLERMGFRFRYPDGTFYIFARHDDLRDVDKFTYELLLNKGVALAPGKSFGGYNEFIRFSASLKEEKLTAAVNRIRDFMNMFRGG